jgi:hypothetical protein
MSIDGFGDMTDELLDLQQMADDERLISALAAGQLPENASGEDLELAELLGGWRSELDATATTLPPFAATAATVAMVEAPAAAVRQSPRRGRRAALAAAAGLVTVLGMTGTAAAISGQHGPFAPLHRVLFGSPSTHADVDPLALRARSLLKTAATDIAKAASAGHIADSQRTAIGSTIDAAGRLLKQDAQPPKDLVQQVESLRAALARIPGQPGVSPSPAPAVAPTSGPSSSTSQQPVTPPVLQLPTEPSTPHEPAGPPEGGPTAEPTEPETDVSEPARPSASPSPSASHESSDDSGTTGSADNTLDP